MTAWLYMMLKRKKQSHVIYWIRSETGHVSMF